MKHIHLILILLLLTITGCDKNSNSGKLVEKYFFDMGTFVQVTIEERKAKDFNKVEGYIKNLVEVIKEDQKNIAEAGVGEAIEVSQEFIELYNYSKNYYEVSSGLFDATSITVSRLYGFPESELKMPEAEEIEKAKENAGFHNIKLDGNKVIKEKNTFIDFSANSKGYIIDKTSAFMKKKGFRNFIINAGGDLYASGLKNNKNPFKVAIQDPDNEKKAASIIKISDKAVATSGNYERFFINDAGERITHIFKGVDFSPCNSYKSVSVIADNTEKADGLATLYFILDVDSIAKYCESYNTPVLLVTLDGEKVKLCGWEGFEEKL